MSSINAENGTASERAADEKARQVIYMQKKRGPLRRFFRSVISHIVFALAILGATFGSLFYFGYLEDSKMLHTAGNYVCAPERLGRYISGNSLAVAQKNTAQSGANVSAVSKNSSDGKAATPGTAPNNRDALRKPSSPAITLKKDDKSSSSKKSISGNTKVAAKIDQLADRKTTSANPAIDNKKNPSGETLVTTEAEGTTSSLPTTRLKNATLADKNIDQQSGSKADSLTTGPRKKQSTTKPLKRRKSLGAAWKDARAAYLAKDKSAIPAYKALIKQHPHVADLPGELGNIYYNEGKFELAADQYMEAAMRHLRGPRPAFASCLIDVLKRISPKRAEKLQALTEDECPQ